MELATRRLRQELDMNRFGAAVYTDTGGWGRAVLARLVGPLIPLALKLLGRRKK